MRLNELKSGRRAVVLGIRGEAVERQRLAGLGLNIGFEVEVVEPPQSPGGAMLVRVCGSRLVLADEVAKTVLVREK
jgi:Fe2+ transport system protein FeoA